MATGFFTCGIECTLPYPKIPHRTILVIGTVIKRAWQLMKERPISGFDSHSADEDTITQLLVEIIENRLRKTGEVDGFNHVLFGKVIREPKITNFDKTHPDKMPDIFFDLKRDRMPLLSDQDGLFVECKPVDRKHSVLSCYCKKGLSRFVNGDYAWAMQDALMIGYAKAPYSYKKLSSVLDDSRSDYLNTIQHSEFSKFEMYRSTHNRNFDWMEKRGQACCINLSHFWLPVTKNVSRPENMNPADPK